MENNTQISDQYYDEIDLRELFMVLWAGKIKIVAITAVFAVASVIYALSVPNQYKATALLAPAQSGGGGLSSALGQLGGLASLAGVSIGGGESSESQIAQEIMKSWSFVEGFIADNNLAVEVYAAEGWSRKSNQLKIDNDIYELSKDSAMWGSLMVGIMPNMRPSLDWADKLMQEFVRIIPAHTIEPFSLAESLLRKYRMTEGKKYVSLYSTSRKKEHAVKIISEFLNKYRELPIDKQISLAQKVVIKRSALKVIKQRILHLLR